MRTARRWAIAASIVGTQVSGLPARAEDVAEILWIQGLADMEAGRYEKGCPAIEESFRLDPRPGTLFTLAECEAKRGRIATAAARYQEYLAQYKTFSPAKQREQAERAGISKRQLTELSPRVPHLTVRLREGTPGDVHIERDGRPVPAATIGVALPIDPGDHVVTLRTNDGAKSEQRIRISAGETKEIVLEAPAAPTASSAPSATASAAATSTAPVPTQAPAWSSQHTVAVAGGVLGVSGLVVGTVAGVVALQKRSIVTERCPTIDTCDPEGLVASGTAKQMATLSTVGFAVGLVGVAAFGVLWATAPKPSKPGIQAVGVGAQGVWIQGQF